MPLVDADDRLSELALLDIVDLRADGTMCLNSEFVAECMRAFDEDPAALGDVVQNQIVARAIARGYRACNDPEDLTLAALELGAAEERTPSA